MTEAFKTNTFFSILWSILSKWSSKLIGMASTMVLARLLTPADFGIIALATIVIAFLDSITDAGLNLYVLRQKQDSSSIFDTAWTLGVIQGFLIAVPLVIGAPWIADFYNQGALQDVIYCLALARILQSFNSLGIIVAQKHLNFKIEFTFTLITRLSYLVSTIGFALYFQSFWALVLGQLVSAVVGCAVSYWVHPYRPKFCLQHWREMLRFSTHTVPFSFGRYINNQLDVAVIGRVAMAEFVGLYHVAVNLATLFTKELLIPVIRGLIPNLSVQKDSENFKQILVTTFAAAVYVFLPIGIGLSMVSYEFVEVILGSQWSAAAPMLSWFSLHAMLAGLMMFFSEQFLVILDKEPLSNKLMWLRNVFLIITLAITLSFYGVFALPFALFICSLVSLPIVLVVISRALQLSIMSLLASWWPAMLSVSVMTYVISLVPSVYGPVILTLLLKVSSAALVYISCLLALYWLRGKPFDSLEQMLLSRIKQQFSR